MNNKLVSKTFLWMFVGLLVTFFTGYFVSINERMVEALYGPLTWVFVIAEILLVIFLSARINKMSATTARISFLLYSFVSGLTFSSVFLSFEVSSIMMVFLVAAIAFLVFGAIGYFTNIDLSKLGMILLMGLFAIIIGVIINLFIGSSTFDLVLSIIGLIIFFGYTAYDMQNLKVISEQGIDNDVVAIYGALELYLDFINIFLHILSIIGDAKD